MQRRLFQILLFISISNTTIAQVSEFYPFQSVSNALLYASNDIKGTARFRAMGEATGALGGDLSSVHINPAGSLFFSKPYITMSFSAFQPTWLGEYNNTEFESSHRHVNIDNFGGVFIDEYRGADEGFQKIVGSVSYDTQDYYFKDFEVQGISENSISNYFLDQAQGIEYRNINENYTTTTGRGLYTFLGNTTGYRGQQAFLGLNSQIIDPVENKRENTSYTVNTGSGDFNQTYRQNSSGTSSKININGAFQLNNVYVGGNVSAHFVNYENAESFYENNDNIDSSIKSINYNNRLSVSAGGFSIQLGAIIKLTPFFRFGLSLTSPTLLNIRERFSQSLITEYLTEQNGSTQLTPYVIDYLGTIRLNNYKLKTPGKATVSGAFILGKFALASVDLGYQNHQDMEFRSSRRSFQLLNDDIRDQLKGAFSFNTGAEIRLPVLSVRAGLRYKESPYKDKEILGDLFGASVGGGIRLGRFRIDATYTINRQNGTNTFYNSNSFNNSYDYRNDFHNIVVGLGLVL